MRTVTGEFLYFGYGSNLCAERLKLANPSARFIATAKLSDYRLVFSRKSKTWSGGAADILKSPGKSVWGIVYAMCNGHAEKLDRQELILNLVAATRVDDKKREERKGTLKETEGRLDKIGEFLKAIDVQQATLEEKTNEVKKHQRHDKRRQALVHQQEPTGNRQGGQECLTDRPNEEGQAKDKRDTPHSELQNQTKETAKHKLSKPEKKKLKNILPNHNKMRKKEDK